MGRYDQTWSLGRMPPAARGCPLDSCPGVIPPGQRLIACIPQACLHGMQEFVGMDILFRMLQRSRRKLFSKKGVSNALPSARPTYKKSWEERDGVRGRGGLPEGFLLPISKMLFAPRGVALVPERVERLRMHHSCQKLVAVRQKLAFGKAFRAALLEIWDSSSDSTEIVKIRRFEKPAVDIHPDGFFLPDRMLRSRRSCVKPSGKASGRR